MEGQIAARAEAGDVVAAELDVADRLLVVLVGEDEPERDVAVAAEHAAAAQIAGELAEELGAQAVHVIEIGVELEAALNADPGFPVDPLERDELRVGGRRERDEEDPQVKELHLLPVPPSAWSRQVLVGSSPP